MSLRGMIHGGNRAFTDVNVFGESMSEEAYVPSPGRSIPVTEEMRRQDAEERAAREARVSEGWKRPEPLPESAYRRAVPEVKPARKPQRKTEPVARKEPVMKTAEATLPPTFALKSTDKIGALRVVAIADLPPAAGKGRIEDLLLDIAKVATGFALEIPCADAKKAVNTLTQLKTKGNAYGKAARPPYVMKGRVSGSVCFAWCEQVGG